MENLTDKAEMRNIKRIFFLQDHAQKISFVSQIFRKLIKMAITIKAKKYLRFKV